MTIRISKTAALKGLKTAVSKRGTEYVYERVDGHCVYVDPHTLQPSCIVGEVLIGAGVDPQTILDSAANSNGIPVAIRKIPDLEISPAALNILAQAQLYQDSGNRWGVARKYAVARAKQLVGQK